MKKRLFCLALAALFMLSLGTTVLASSFSDLSEDSWYYNEIQSMTDAGYLNGYPDGTFQGENNITVAEFITIIARILDLPTGEMGHWAGIQMIHAIREGWVNGYDLSLVGYNDPISCQLAAKVIIESMNIAPSHIPASQLSIMDSIIPDSAYIDYVKDAFYYGVFDISSAENFNPFSTLGRSEAALLISHSLNNVTDIYDRYSDQEIIDYFVEVAMSAEYDAFGNPSGETRPIVKWSSPVCWSYSGNYTAEDASLLKCLMDEVNSIEGFPGFVEAEDYFSSNFRMRFAMAEEMDYVQGFYNPEFDGYFTVWWDNWSIYDAQLYYRAENLEQYYRNPTLCEELLQALGIMNDSYLYPDSLFYQPFNTVQWPADIDWIVLELLYDPAIYPGMSEFECRAALADILANK